MSIHPKPLLIGLKGGMMSFRVAANNELGEAVVTKVGREYFYFKAGHFLIKISLLTLKEPGGNYPYTVFLKREDHEDFVLREKFANKIISINCYNLSKIPTEKLKTIYDILTENETTT